MTDVRNFVCLGLVPEFPISVLLVRTMANDGEAVRQNLALGTLATQQSKITMNWFGKKKDSGSSSAPSGGGGGGGGDPSQTIVKLREAVATQEKR